MSDAPPPLTSKEQAKRERAERLAAELRANLLRRKQQAKARLAPADEPAPSPGSQRTPGK